MMLSADQGIMDSDEIAVYERCRNFIHYVMHMKANVYEYAMEFDLQMLARFLSISIYIFPTDDKDVFEVNETRTIDFYIVIHLFDYISQKYITVVRNKNYYKNNVRQIAEEEFNSSKNDNTIFCRIRELQKLPRIRRSREITGLKFIKNIEDMRPGGKFRDGILNGFLCILNFKYNDKMDYANIFFSPEVKELNFDADYIKLVTRSRLRYTSIFDFNGYLFLNHIGDDHWGIIHVLPKEKSIICFDGYHYKQQEEYEIVSRCLDILRESLSITEFQNCQ